jgi:micrococcal nuclease
MRTYLSRLFLALILMNFMFVSFLTLLNEGFCYEVDDTGTVTYIVDGDTVDVSSVGRIRLADIDAPDEGEPGKDEATAYISSLIYQKTVYVDIDDVYGTDIYGRIVAVLYVYYDTNHLKNVNKAVLDSGHAVI